ncbi:hypothetical protein [Myroides sp. DW712]|uniref:hypothetical protein n=1 Tax=Myroides sp. DW712 TaxID=3389800 RepID=UPI00397DA061
MFRFCAISYLVVVVLLITSCQKKEPTYDLQLDYMYHIYGKEIEKDCGFLKKSLQVKKVNWNLETPSNWNQLDREIQAYYLYLERLDSLSRLKQENLFYTADEINTEGKLFVKKSNELMRTIEEVVDKHTVLYARIDLLLGVQDIRSEEEKGLYFKYLDYNFLGVPPHSFNYLVKMRKRNVLLVQNELWNDWR